ncbi:MAG: protein kinase, partial [Nitrospira sp.]|nr:protein kinase [Nitrospira sp.]
ILDFGLARLLTEASGLTVGDRAIGSPSFAAPEQAAGQHRRVGPATDVYSLGAILYHLLARRPPFVAETLAATMKLVEESEPVDVRRLNPAVPADLATICAKCLEKDPDRRYSTAEALADDLGRFLRDEPIAARPGSRLGRSWRWCRRRPLVAGLAAALSLVSLAVMIGSPVAAFRIDRARQEAEREAYTAGIGLAQSHIEQGSIDLALNILTQCPPRFRHWEWGYLVGRCHEDMAAFQALPSTNTLLLAFSDDASLLLTLGHHGVLQVWDPVAGQERFRCDFSDEPVRCAAIAPSTHRLAAGFGSGVLRFWRIERPALRDEPAPESLPVFRPWREVSAHQGGVNGLVWIEGGRRLVTGGNDGRVRVWEADDGRLVLDLVSPWPRVAEVWFDPAGDCIGASNNGQIGLWDLTSGQPRRAFNLEERASDRIWSDTHTRRWVVAERDGRLTLRDAQGATQPLTQARGLFRLRRSVSFSGDGRWICTAGDENTARVWRALDGREHFALPGRVHESVFSPDSRLLATLGSCNYAVLWDVEKRREI